MRLWMDALTDAGRGLCDAVRKLLVKWWRDQEDDDLAF